MNDAVHVKVKIVKLNLVRIGARPINVDLASIDNTSLRERVILNKMGSKLTVEEKKKNDKKDLHSKNELIVILNKLN